MFVMILNIYSMIKSTKSLYNWSREPDMELTEDMTVQTKIRLNKKIIGNDRGVVLDTDGKLTIAKGYKWDGCTNVPDGELVELVDLGLPIKSTNKYIPETWEASIVHDALYGLLIENSRDADGMFTRKDADTELRRFMAKKDPIRAKVYYYGIRLFGGRYLRWATKSYKKSHVN